MNSLYCPFCKGMHDPKRVCGCPGSLAHEKSQRELLHSIIETKIPYKVACADCIKAYMAGDDSLIYPALVPLDRLIDYQHVGTCPGCKRQFRLEVEG